MRLELRPSVLKISSNSSETNESNSTEKVHLEDNVFKFAPLIRSETPEVGHGSQNKGLSLKASCASNNTTNSVEPEFVFGHNLEERVILSETTDETETTEQKATRLENTNHFTEKRKYEAITGEEDESNVLQIYCKLYLWDSPTASWRERGKGILRLNDKMKDDKLCSRLVMRTSGSLKVILNSLIVNGMIFEHSKEHIRFTNIDGIYLIKGKDKDIEQLYSAIDCRLEELSKKNKNKGVDQNQTIDPRIRGFSKKVKLQEDSEKGSDSNKDVNLEIKDEGEEKEDEDGSEEIEITKKGKEESKREEIKEIGRIERIEGIEGIAEKEKEKEERAEERIKEKK